MSRARRMSGTEGSAAAGATSWSCYGGTERGPEPAAAIFDALWGLIFWGIVGTAGMVGFGTIEGVPLWRLVFFAGYAGYLMGCYTRRPGA